jgi:hypothetical protein
MTDNSRRSPQALQIESLKDSAGELDMLAFKAALRPEYLRHVMTGNERRRSHGVENIHRVALIADMDDIRSTGTPA